MTAPADLDLDECRRLCEQLTGEQSLHRLALDEHGERLTTLADQLAGLQRLVETLVNERGELGQSLTHHSKTLVEHAAALDRHEEQLRDDYIMRPAVPIVEGVAETVELIAAYCDDVFGVDVGADIRAGK